jgi:hypothetical protein
MENSKRRSSKNVDESANNFNLTNPIYSLNDIAVDQQKSTTNEPNLSEIYEEIRREISGTLEPIGETNYDLRNKFEQKLRENFPDGLVMICASVSTVTGLGGILLVLAFVFLVLDSVGPFELFIFCVLAVMYALLVVAGLVLLIFSKCLILWLKLYLM